MQHVLFLGKVWPEPGSSAAGSRTLQLIGLFIDQGWKISFACAAGESEFATDLNDMGVQKFNVEINSSAFDDLIKNLQPGIVVFDRFTTEEQFGWRVAQHCPKALRILDTIDLHCLRTGRHEALKAGKDFELNSLLTYDVAKREIASIYRCDLSLMVSEAEIEILEHTFKVDRALLHYTPLLYEPLSGAQTGNWKNFEERQHFASIGNFLHEPNWDSVLFLKKEIWPLVRKRLPKAELHIYGAYATQKVFELHNEKEGFLIKGRAGSADEVMSKARICLAPLRFGAGVKGKLLDAMLCGTPSVTTSIGAESMHRHLPWNGKIEKTTEDLAEAAVHLYSNEAAWKEAQQNGAAIINSIFSVKEHSPKLLEKIVAALKELRQHRATNFTGAMLQQQHNAATKYMALWIEEKNKTPKKM